MLLYYAEQPVLSPWVNTADHPCKGMATARMQRRKNEIAAAG
jgi:hypothetical protein